MSWPIDTLPPYPSQGLRPLQWPRTGPGPCEALVSFLARNPCGICPTTKSTNTPRTMLRTTGKQRHQCSLRPSGVVRFLLTNPPAKFREGRRGNHRSDDSSRGGPTVHRAAGPQQIRFTPRGSLTVLRNVAMTVNVDAALRPPRKLAHALVSDPPKACAGRVGRKPHNLLRGAGRMRRRNAEVVFPAVLSSRLLKEPG